MLLSGSPDYNIDRTFISIFYFPHIVTKSIKATPVYRNPVYIAREYGNMIDNGQVRNQSELTHKFGISRARVTQILNLLKLQPLVIQELEKFGDPINSKLITERILRPYANKSPKE